MDSGNGRIVRSAGALGPCHPRHVLAGLLAHMAEGTQVLHLRWGSLLHTGCGGLHYLPHPRHHTEAMPAYSLPDFDRKFDMKKRTFPIGQKVKKCFRCSGSRLKSLLFRHLPILSWLPKYKVKENLLCDVISGVSAGTIQVPQGMAFALLANLPPVNGLHSSFFPLIPYFFMGTAHQMVPGTFAVISIMVGMECLKLAPESDFNATINATVMNEDRMNEVRLGISGTLACLTAIIQMCLGLMQFGFVAIYLSESFVRGFMTAAGLQILISVLKYIFGIKVPFYSGPLATINTLKDIVYGLPNTNIASLVFALISSVVIITVKELGARYHQKLPFPIPMEIIIVVVATAISGPLGLPDKYHIDIVGKIPLGFPAPILPTVSQWEGMLSSAFSLAIVGYVVNLAIGKTMAAKHGYNVDPNQVSSLCVMLVVMVTMLALGHFLKPLPKSVLGALIAINLKNTLLQLSDPYYLWKKSKLDLCVGCLIFSHLLPEFALWSCHWSQLLHPRGYFSDPVSKWFRDGSDHGHRYIQRSQGLQQEIFQRKVIKKTGLDPGKLLLARKKLLKKQQKELDRQNKENKKRKPSSLVTMRSQTLSQLELQNDCDIGNGNPYPPPSPTSCVNFHCSDNELGEQSRDPDQPSASPVILNSQPIPFHTLILDLSGVCFIDLMGIKVLTKMYSSYEMLGIKLYLANVQAQVYEELEGGEMFEEGSVPRCHLFLTVHDAILCALQRSRNTGGCEKGSMGLQTEQDKKELVLNFQEDEERDLEQEMF
ncbi:solute carrier family 26 member 9-like isoform X4 [Oncorhynchus tshawytscha]|uniref:solute carrier family 26 member 9-like isoform X4 n=1 Tax=Oncorhynchus tshawytscha TaxID=74940 RepID=UPI001C3C2368|nr:solute carrier family 26 member 9-like isoform X4 [Oncorhynchus tshawytscha]